jgi:glutamate 5-kinase
MRNLNTKRIVVKIGTNTITNTDGSINTSFLKNITKQLLKLKKQSKELIIVSSGAIGLGVKELNLNKMPRDIETRQAAAAIGQTNLMAHWKKYFKKQKVAQLLVTYESFTNRKTYLNLTTAINALLKLNVIPIINENDPIAIEEIGASFGDNDKMSALVASKSNADLLIVLSNISGLYTRNPSKNKDAQFIKEVTEITQNIKSMAHKKSSRGKGGMQTKLEAAEICSSAGIPMIIADGNEKNVLTKITNNDDLGTIFLPKQKLSTKKRWILFSPSKGKVFVDDCVESLLNEGKNLLPIGINRVEGKFKKNDVVEITHKGKTFAKAVIDYDSDTLNKIKKLPNQKNAVKRENLVMV